MDFHEKVSRFFEILLNFFCLTSLNSVEKMFHVLPFQNYFNRVHLSSVFFVGTFFITTFSFGASINNFGQWSNLNSVSKTIYTAGAIDTLIKPPTEFAEHEIFIANFEACLKAFNLTVINIVQMIDNFYLNTKNWGLSPQEAIRFQLVNGHCFHFFNK